MQQQVKHTDKLQTQITMSTPYELRWEIYQQAEQRLRDRYEAEVRNYETILENVRCGISDGVEIPSPPVFPSDFEIHQLATQIKNFISDKEVK